MDTKTMINQLKYEAEKHKNDSLFTGQTNITALCSDVIPKLEKLAEYETSDDEGRLVVLPCDTIYFICDKGTKDAHVRTKSILDLLVYDINGIDKDGRYWSVKEEAEKALKEMKKNE